MDTFKRIRSGISELKKENADLKTNYDFLAGELRRLVETNSREIKDYKKALLEFSERIHKAQSAAVGWKEGVREARQHEKSMSSYMDEMDKRINGLSSLRDRIKEIEKAGDALLKGVQDLKELSSNVAVLDERLSGVEASLTERGRTMETKLVERGKRFESGVSAELSGVEKDMAKGMADIKKAVDSVSSRVNSLEALRERVKVIEDAKDALIAGMGDLTEVNEGVGVLEEKISSLEAGQSATKKEVESLEALRQKARDIEQLEKTLSAKLSEMKPLQRDVAAIKRDLSAGMQQSQNSDSVLEDKLDYNITSLKKESAFNSASLARLDEEMHRLSLEMQSMKKDWKTGSKDMAVARSMLADTQKKLADLEKLQIKLRGMESTKEALSNAMDSQLEEKMKFLEAMIRQRGDNIKAELKAEQAGIAKRAGSLEKEVKDMRSGLTKSIAGMRSDVDSAKLGSRDKFDSAVKAFLTARGDMNSRMSGLNVKMTELEKMMDEFSRSLLRMDLLEKKMDRLSDRSADIRRSMDKIESKEEESAGQQVMLVDLDSEKGEA